MLPILNARACEQSEQYAYLSQSDKQLTEQCYAAFQFLRKGKSIEQISCPERVRFVGQDGYASSMLAREKYWSWSIQPHLTPSDTKHKSKENCLILE